MTEFMRSSDAFLWSIERDPGLRSTIVLLVLLDRSPDWDEVSDRFDRLSRVFSMFRQRVLESPPPAPPRWVFDSDFDLGFHLRRVKAPEPGTLDTVLEMVRFAVMADFDRARPLWEATLVDGLADGGAALFCKVNHALTDGVGGIQIAMNLFDLAGQQRKRLPLPSEPRVAAPQPLQGLRDTVRYQVGLAGAVLTGPVKSAPTRILNGIRHPMETVAAVGSTAASIYRMARPISRSGSPIMRNRKLIRQLGVHDVSKTTLRQAGHVAGGSLNDAFIAGVTGGLRRYHQKHDVAVDDLIMNMPVNIRTAADAVGGNRATLMRLGVPVAVADPAERIRIIHERTTGARTEKSLPYTQLIAGVLNVMPRSYVASVLRHVDFVASDVPGIPVPVSFAGSAVRMQYAFAPTIGAGLNVTLLSYVDTCALGINVDTGAIPDYDVFYDCLIDGFDEVLALGR